MTIEKYLENIEDLSNRIIALTGGTNGIGLALLHHLINKNAKVILLALDVKIANKLKKEYKDNILDVIEYDQGSFESIENAIDLLNHKHHDVDTIALNAGVLGQKGVTKEGYAATIGINYVGVRHFIEYFNKTNNNKVRFVIQGSIVACGNLKYTVDLKNEYLKTFTQYNVSKIYLEAYYYKLIKENNNPNREYILTEPGISSTGIIYNFNIVVRFLGKYFLKIFFHSPKKASLAMLKGISSSSHNGELIRPRGLCTMSGFPKTSKFPKKRRKEHLFENEKQDD